MRIEWYWDCGHQKEQSFQTLEIPDEELEGMTKKEQDRIIEDHVHEAFLDAVPYFWERKE